MNRPLISVVIPAYNVAPYIGDTLQSVFAQQRNDFEVIVVNDGSDDTPELEKVLAAFMPKIIYVRQPQMGASAARNTAIDISTGDFLAFLDGDDVWKPDYLNEQMAFLEKHDLEMVYCNTFFIGGPDYDNQTFMDLAPSSGPVNFESVLSFQCNIPLSGVVVRRNCVTKVGGFDIDIRRAMDFILWLRLLANGTRVGYHRKALLFYRIRESGLTGDVISMTKRDAEALELAKQRFNLTPQQDAIVKREIARINAATQTLIGKDLLLKGRFSEARDALIAANRYRKSILLWLFIISLSMQPTIATVCLRLFLRLKNNTRRLIRRRLT